MRGAGRSLRSNYVGAIALSTQWRSSSRYTQRSGRLIAALRGRGRTTDRHGPCRPRRPTPRAAYSRIGYVAGSYVAVRRESTPPSAASLPRYRTGAARAGARWRRSSHPGYTSAPTSAIADPGRCGACARVAESPLVTPYSYRPYAIWVCRFRAVAGGRVDRFGGMKKNNNI